ncbi:hypothetical protein AVEN_93553-1 [Araneus ventricosus]|uniref:Uncharacterized protein n=1 Tax=Araneus ventricosus TaxID=182803 RepID=A0A4Y2APH1_ARAVE|nr:hypothetical protein AVEN_93553-1 [Araneus ventricosus]
MLTWIERFWCTLQPCVTRGRFLRVAIKIVIRLSFFVHTILLLCKRARLPVLSGSEEILTVDPCGGLAEIAAFSRDFPANSELWKMNLLRSAVWSVRE